MGIMRPIKAELVYGGKHDGTGFPHKDGSYVKITIVEEGSPADDPQVLTFLIPGHQWSTAP